MQEKLYLGVRNRKTGEFYVAGCTTPVQIGRQSDVDNQILLDWQDRRISRVHGTIERTSRGFIYTDRSSQGSRVGGLEVRSSKAALPQNFQIDIEDYSITKAEVTPFVIVHTDAKLSQIEQVELLPGRGLGLLDAPGGPRLIDLNRWTEWGKSTVGRLEITDDQPLWIQASDVEPRAIKNKSPVRQARTVLTSLDVIEIDGHRFEVLHPHEARIVCGNAACHLLNPPPLAGNCRYCGRDLAGTGGFSRVL